MISIIIPCYRGEAYLRAAIESCLAQAYEAVEVIVVDDASPDRCGEIAAGYAAKDKRFRVITHPENLGVAEAFNTGFSAAKGDYLTRLAQDDLFLPGALEVLATGLDAEMEVDMVYADMEFIDSTGNVIGAFDTLTEDDALGICNGIGVCWMFRRKIWDSGLRFDAGFDQVEDFEFWMRASRQFKIRKVVGAPLLQFRQHDKSGTALHSARMELATASVIARHADSQAEITKALAEGFFNASYIHREQGDARAAIRLGLQALALQPIRWRNWRNLAGILVKGVIRNK